MDQTSGVHFIITGSSNVAPWPIPLFDLSGQPDIDLPLAEARALQVVPRQPDAPQYLNPHGPPDLPEQLLYSDDLHRLELSNSPGLFDLVEPLLDEDLHRHEYLNLPGLFDLPGPILHDGLNGLGYLNPPGPFDLPEPLLYDDLHRPEYIDPPGLLDLPEQLFLWDDVHPPEYLDPGALELLGLPELLDLAEPLRPEQLSPPRLEDQPPVAIIDQPIVERQNPPLAIPELCNGKCNGGLIGPHRCQRLKRRLQITCLSNDCTHVFTTKNDFNRHCNTRHGLRESLLDCSFAGCNKVGENGFSRRDNMLQHLREVHGAEVQRTRFRIRGSRRGVEV
ncbi:hypothetical protein DFP73DRAFT_635876 [Morchella snyderi]|nr:hypothetical protein DFP73DRAFT_635876 [Morchella snyderi]